MPAVTGFRFQAGVEARQVGVQLRVLLEIDVVVEDHEALALVLDLEARAVREGHGEPAVEALAVLGAHLQGERDEVPAQAESEAEEVSQRDLHARGLLPVPVHSQHRLAQLVGIGGERHQRDPDVLHTAGAADLPEAGGLSGLDLERVRVAPRAVPGREAPALEVAKPCQTGERAASDLHGCLLHDSTGSGIMPRFRSGGSVPLCPIQLAPREASISAPSKSPPARSARV